jgi:PAS domain-containing protein
MGTLQNLTSRTAKAVGRLAELQRRADRVVEKPSFLTKTALAELSTALEELQVASEALQVQFNDLAAAREVASNTLHTLDEFANAMPMAVLWTDVGGVIDKGNDSASQLLNIGKHHLQGKPLMLFVTDRAVLFAALQSVCEENQPPVEVEVTVRPRERRPRKMRLRGRRLEHDARCVWFLHEPHAEVPVLD